MERNSYKNQFEINFYFTGKRNRLKWVNQLVYKSFNKKIDQPRTESDWLSSQSTEVDKFVNDEYTGF